MSNLCAVLILPTGILFAWIISSELVRFDDSFVSFVRASFSMIVLLKCKLRSKYNGREYLLWLWLFLVTIQNDSIIIFPFFVCSIFIPQMHSTANCLVINITWLFRGWHSRMQSNKKHRFSLFERKLIELN